MSKPIIKTVKLTDIHEFDGNPRQIKKDDFERLKKSLKEFPEMLDVREIVIDEDGAILGGNQRYKALLANGETEATVKQVVGWSEAKKREFVIKDNIANGEWDMDTLANQWDDLPLGDWGVNDIKPLVDIVEDEPSPVDDENTCSIVGEIYKLGDHRVFCGSFDDDEKIRELFGSRKATCTFTDPPYNVAVKSRTTGKTIENDDMDSADFQDFLNRAFECVASNMSGGGRNKLDVRCRNSDIKRSD